MTTSLAGRVPVRGPQTELLDVAERRDICAALLDVAICSVMLLRLHLSSESQGRSASVSWFRCLAALKKSTIRAVENNCNDLFLGGGGGVLSIGVHLEILIRGLQVHVKVSLARSWSRNIILSFALAFSKNWRVKKYQVVTGENQRLGLVTWWWRIYGLQSNQEI